MEKFDLILSGADEATAYRFWFEVYRLWFGGVLLSQPIVLLPSSPLYSVPVRLLYPPASLWYDDDEVAVVPREWPRSACRFPYAHASQRRCDARQV